MRNPLRIPFVRDVAVTGGTQVMQAASAMLAGILVARALGPSAKGQLSVLAALGSVTVLLLSFGVHNSGVYFLGKYKTEQRAIVSNNLLIAVVGGIVSAALLGLVGLLFSNQLLNDIHTVLFLIFLIYVPFNYFNEFVRRLMLGFGRVGMYNLPDLVSGGGLVVGTAVVLLLWGGNLVVLIIARIVVEVIISIVLCAQLLRSADFQFAPSLSVLRRQATYSVKNYASSLLWIFLLQSDLVLCNHFLGDGPTGIYSVTVALGIPIIMLGSVVGTLVFQRSSSDEDSDTRVANTNRVARVLVPILTVSMTLLALLATWLVPVIYGHAFADATDALLLLLPGLGALSLELVFMNYLAGTGSPPMVYIAPLVGLVFNLSANFYAIPRWGINGAAATSSLGYLVVLFLVLWYYLRSTGTSVRDVLIVRFTDIGLQRPLARTSGL